MLAFLLHEAPGASTLHTGAKQAALTAGLALLREDLLSQEAMDFANADLWGPCIVRSGPCCCMRPQISAMHSSYHCPMAWHACGDVTVAPAPCPEEHCSGHPALVWAHCMSQQMCCHAWEHA